MFDYEIEKKILGSLLSDTDTHNLIPKINETDFNHPKHKIVFEAIEKAYTSNEPIESTNIYSMVKEEITDALTFLVTLESDIMTTANFKFYFEKLKDLSCRRKLALQCKEFINSLSDTSKPVNEVKSNYQMQLDNINVLSTEKRKRKISEIMQDVMQELEEKYNQVDDKKLYTGFYDLDKLTAGLHRGELTIIAARPGIGKTAFAINLLLNLAEKNNKVVMYTLEMSAKENVKRVLSRFVGIDGQKIRLPKNLQPKDWEQVVKGMNCPDAEIVDDLYNIAEIRADLREMHNKGELDAVIIDYLQLAETSAKCNTRNDYVGVISRELKKMSKEFNVPIIALAQLNREGTQRPKKEHLRDSGNIEQDADNIFFLWVENEEDQRKPFFEIVIIVDKQRNGPVGDIKLGYNKSTFAFLNIEGRRG